MILPQVHLRNGEKICVLLRGVCLSDRLSHHAQSARLSLRYLQVCHHRQVPTAMLVCERHPNTRRERGSGTDPSSLSYWTWLLVIHCTIFFDSHPTRTRSGAVLSPVGPVTTRLDSLARPSRELPLSTWYKEVLRNFQQ